MATVVGQTRQVPGSGGCAVANPPTPARPGKPSKTSKSNSGKASSGKPSSGKPGTSKLATSKASSNSTTSSLRPKRRSGPRADQPRQLRQVHIRRPTYDAEAFGRWSEGIARFLGTGRFLIYMTAFIILWLVWNTLAPAGWQFDPYTFTFLTLILSLQASYAAPLILLAQNRQDDRDRVNLEQDREQNARALADMEFLAREIAALRIALGEVATRDFVRGELRDVVEQMDERLHRAEQIAETAAPDAEQEEHQPQ